MLCDPHGNHKVKTCGRLKKKKIKREESRISPQKINKSQSKTERKRGTIKWAEHNE